MDWTRTGNVAINNVLKTEGRSQDCYGDSDHLLLLFTWLEDLILEFCNHLRNEIGVGMGKEWYRCHQRSTIIVDYILKSIIQSVLLHGSILIHASSLLYIAIIFCHKFNLYGYSSASNDDMPPPNLTTLVLLPPQPSQIPFLLILAMSIKSNNYVEHLIASWRRNPLRPFAWQF